MSRWVVTGANRGIGLELARQLVARGDEVVASARSLGNAAALAALAKANPTKLRVAACDVRDDASVRAFAAVVGDAPLHGLFNNAGVMGKMQSLEELDTDDMVATFDTNALGPIRVTRALLSQLWRPSRRGWCTSRAGWARSETTRAAVRTATACRRRR